MSKSLGNVRLVHDLVKEAPGEAIRWALLSAHYRAPLDWTGSLIEQAKKTLDGLYGVLQRAKSIEPQDVTGPSSLDVLLDDLNTPQAASQLRHFADQLDKAVAEGSDAAGGHKHDLMILAGVLGVLQQDPEAWFKGAASDDLAAKVEALLEQRIAARAAKDWPEADRIRAELDGLGVVVMDSPTGATWRMRD